MSQETDLTLQQKEAVWRRQNGMCGFSGKKFDELLHGSVEYHFTEIRGDKEAGQPETESDSGENSPSEQNGEAKNLDNFVMLWNQYKDYVDTPGDEGFELKLKKYCFPYANFENYATEDMLKDIEADVNTIITKAKERDDTNAAIDAVKDMAQDLKSLKIDREDRNRLSEKLKETLDELYVKKKEQSEIEAKEQEANYEVLKSEIGAAVKFSEESGGLKEAREKIINYQNRLKDTSLKKERSDELFNQLNAAFETLNERMNIERESYEQECIDNYYNIKVKIDEALEKIAGTEDFREARRILINMQGEFKGLKLKKEGREEQYARIQEAFEKINKKSDEERQKFELEAEYNYDKLKDVVGEAVEFSKKSEFFKHGRSRLIEAQNEIRDKALKKSQRDELYSAIRAAFEDINRRQDQEREKFEAEAKANYDEVKPMVEEVIAFAESATYFKEARNKLIAMQRLLKEKKLKKFQKDELFSAIRDAFERLNKRQDEERKNFEEETENNYTILKENVYKAIEFANNTEDYGQARQNLISAQKSIKGMRLKKSHRDELFGAIRECFNNLNDKSEEEKTIFEENSRENYEKLIPRLQKALDGARELDDFREIRENLVALQNELKILKLKRKHRNELFEYIKKSFAIFDERQDKSKVETKLERQEKLVFVLSTLKEKRDRIKESIDRDKEILEEKEKQMETVELFSKQAELSRGIDAVKKRIGQKEKSLIDVDARIEEIKEELES